MCFWKKNDSFLTSYFFDNFLYIFYHAFTPKYFYLNCKIFIFYSFTIWSKLFLSHFMLYIELQKDAFVFSKPNISNFKDFLASCYCCYSLSPNVCFIMCNVLEHLSFLHMICLLIERSWESIVSGILDYLLSCFRNSSINSSCDSCGLFGPRTSISNLAHKSIMGASCGVLFSLLFP